MLGVAALLVTGVWVGTSLVHAPLTTVDLNRGARLFQQRCASCHALDHTQASLYGPHLGNIGELAALRVPAQSAEAYLLQSIIDPNAYRNPGEHGVMPADISGGLSPTDLTSLVGYLLSHGGSLNWPRLLAIMEHARAAEVETVEVANLADLEGGKAIYLSKANCNACHPLQATPGGTLLAPSLLSAGQHSREYLRESIVHPSKSIAKGYGTTTVWLEDGRTVTGRVVRSTPEWLELIAIDNGTTAIVSIPRKDIMWDEDEGEMLRQMPHSMMPDNLASTLSENEIMQLLAFLQTLK